MAPTFSRLVPDLLGKRFLLSMPTFQKAESGLTHFVCAARLESVRKKEPLLANDKTEYVLVFRPYITLRNGRRIYARERGKRAFAFWVPRKRS